MHYVWKPEYSVGDSKIDAQHRQLIALANFLADACEDDLDDVAVEKAFKTLFDYTRNHFSDEERYFAELNYQHLEEHRRKHGVLAEEVNRLWKDGNLGFLDTLRDELSDWVNLRLVPHMMVDDRRALTR